MAEPFKIGDWLVRPDHDELSRDDTVVHLRPQVMDLLKLLASRPGEVLSTEEILDELWRDKDAWRRHGCQEETVATRMVMI